MELDRLGCAERAVVRPDWPDIRCSGQKQCDPSSSNNFCLIPGHPCTTRAHFGSVHSIPFHPGVQKRSYGVLRKKSSKINTSSNL